MMFMKMLKENIAYTIRFNNTEGENSVKDYYFMAICAASEAVEWSLL